MNKKKLEAQVEKAMNTVLRSQELDQTADDKKKNAFFTVNVSQTVQKTDSNMAIIGQTMQKNIKDFGFSDEEIFEFAKKLQIFVKNLGKK